MNTSNIFEREPLGLFVVVALVIVGGGCICRPCGYLKSSPLILPKTFVWYLRKENQTSVPIQFSSSLSYLVWGFNTFCIHVPVNSSVHLPQDSSGRQAGIVTLPRRHRPCSSAHCFRKSLSIIHVGTSLSVLLIAIIPLSILVRLRTILT